MKAKMILNKKYKIKIRRKYVQILIELPLISKLTTGRAYQKTLPKYK